MALNDMQFRMYPRQTPEAIDLGLQMARRWWPQLLLVWCLISLPVLLLSLWLLGDKPNLAITVIWWLKPLLEMVQLHILSRAVFGETTTIRSAMGAWKTVGLSRILLALTLRRFDMQRSFGLPVTQLEGLRGKARQQRLGILLRKDGGYAVGLTVCGSMMETLLGIAFCQLAFMLVPVEYWSGFGEFLFARDHTLIALQAVAFWLAMMLVGPFYVAAGFAMYLNQRVLLEGWDIELSFRRLQLRNTRPAATVRSDHLAILVLAFALVASSAAPLKAQASPGSSSPAVMNTAVVNTAVLNTVAMSPEELQQEEKANAAWQIGNVLADPVFHDMRTTYWPKGWHWDKPDLPKTDFSWLDKDTLLALARFFLALLWVIAGLLVLWLVWRYRQVLPYIGSLRPHWKRRAKPLQLFDLDISPESLPENIPAVAQALWQQQRYREALSLLYRGSLSRLVHEHHFDLRDSATEGEVLGLVRRKSLPAVADYFSTLTAAWQQLAYAHRLPDDRSVDALCAGWSPAFDNTSDQYGRAEYR